MSPNAGGFAVLTSSTKFQCPHGAKGNFTPTQKRVTINGQQVLTKDASSVIAGCSFVLPPPANKPSPCLQFKVLQAATRVTVRVGKKDVPVLIETPGAFLAENAEKLPQGLGIIVPSPQSPFQSSVTTQLFISPVAAGGGI